VDGERCYAAKEERPRSEVAEAKQEAKGEKRSGRKQGGTKQKVEGKNPAANGG
jgi:hypothetical protein